MIKLSSREKQGKSKENKGHAIAISENGKIGTFQEFVPMKEKTHAESTPTRSTFADFNGDLEMMHQRRPAAARDVHKEEFLFQGRLVLDQPGHGRWMDEMVGWLVGWL